jgi:NitT/TauT family transport system substrate-binding protein
MKSNRLFFERKNLLKNLFNQNGLLTPPKYLAFFLFVALLLLVACQSGGSQEETSGEGAGTATSASLMPLRLPMGFVADPQYAPFYVAAEKGYFAEAGLEVEYDYSYETDGVALVGAGELPFAIVSGEQVILARAQEVPVVYVMEWFQRFPIAVVSKAAAGIERPADLAGREIGLPGFFGASYVGFAGLLAANGLTEDDVEASEIGFTQVESLLSDQVEAVVGYANNEPVQLEAAGQDVNVIYVADSADLVANGIITNEETIRDDPELVQGFVGAVLRGLADTLADPDGAYEISKKYVEGLDDSRRPVLEASLDLWRADTLGLTDAASWEATQQVLLDIGFIDEPLANLSAAYTNDFVLATQP